MHHVLPLNRFKHLLDGVTVNPRFRLLSVFVMTAIVLFRLPVVSAQSPTAIPADEDTTHQGRWRLALEADLIAEKFDDLDRLAETYRRDKGRLPGGDWKLRAFYEALDAPQLTDKDTTDHLNHLEHWMKMRPESITARVALATSLHRWAWVARGNGFANTVTPEMGKLYHERSEEADAVLEGSRDMKRMCPQWYSQMLAVAVDEGWGVQRMREIFDRGVQFEPEYQYLYKQYAYAILPKWYGKPGESAEFAKAIADHLGADTGDMMYFHIASNLVRLGDGGYPLDQLDWPRIRHGYQVLIARFGESNRTTNELAYMAYRYKDREIAQQQFAIIGDNWAPGVWRDRKLFDRARDWSNGHTNWP